MTNKTVLAYLKNTNQTSGNILAGVDMNILRATCHHPNASDEDLYISPT